MPCDIDGCERLTVGRGLCAAHYAKWAKYGDPLMEVRPGYGTGRRVQSGGYVEVWAPDHPLAMSHGYVLEHRKAMFDLGHDISGKHVHHVNGDRQDNRPENLEVLDPGTHRRTHQRETVRNKFGVWVVYANRPSIPCPSCGTSFLPRGRGGSGAPVATCSKSCGAKWRRARLAADR